MPVIPQLNGNGKARQQNANAQPASVRPANAAAQAQAAANAARVQAQQAQAATLRNGAQAASGSTVATTSNPERERIRDFWLALPERERRALVKTEKESVLRKMKEQQRHGCSCAVCGRKRGAIEEELEVLYDAYYDELESYAFHQQRHKSSNGAIPPPPGPGPFPGSVDYNPPPVPAAAPAQTAGQKKSIAANAANKRAPPAKNPPADKKAGNHKHNPSCPHHPHHHHHHGGKCSHNHTPASTQPQSEEEEEESYDEEDEDEEEEEEEEYSEGEYEESGSEESPAPPSQAPVKTASNGKPVPMPAPHANKQVVTAPPPKKSAPATNPAGKGDFFNFTNSLAVKGGILTVADDLLKNDGQKFLEMMESLADKRIQREREAAEHLNFEEDEEEDDEEYDGSFF